MSEVTTVLSDAEIEQLAEVAIEVYRSASELNKKLDKIKNDLRTAANGEHKKIDVPGQGSVTVSVPRHGGEVTGSKIEVNTVKLEENPDLKTLLIKKGIIKEVEIISTPATASVTIKPNI